MVLVLTCFYCPLAIAVACLRILPLCLYGSGMFVVFGGCVTTVMFLIVALWVPIDRSLVG